MVLNKGTIVSCGLILVWGTAAIAAATPRLSLTQTSFAVPVAAGSNGPTQEVDAINLGDGSLNLTATSAVSWLVPTVGKKQSCSLRGLCIPITIALQTSALTAGTYTGSVAITDPNAVDTPQFVSVTAWVGGNVPDSLEFFVAPGGTASQDFITATPVTSKIQPASSWLSIGVDGGSSTHINVPYKVTVKASTSMSGDSNATITLSGSSFAADNKQISVVMHVTTSPIVTTASKVSLTGVQGQGKQNAAIGIANSGQGTLSVSGVTATAASGSWLSATLSTDGSIVTITGDPASLDPGVYPGTVTIASNAANSSVVVPVQFTVEPQTAPVAFAGGAVNNGTFVAGESLAQGDIAAIFGDQFTYGDVNYPDGLPLPTNLNGTQVLVNNIAAPLFYISNSQIDFEVPFEVSGDTTIRVVRNGQQGNLIAVNIAARAPRFLLLNGGPYAIMNTPDSPPVLTGIPAHPSKKSDVVVAYIIGLGQTNPPVKTGDVGPSGTLAQLTDVQVCFGQDSPFSKSVCETADFAGLAPGFVALGQLNFKIPGGLPSGNNPIYFVVGGVSSNLAQIVLQ